MSLCHGVLYGVALFGALGFGFLSLHWLQAIQADVNKTLVPDEQDAWGWFDLNVPNKERFRRGLKMHWFWDQHIKLFPASRKRIYCSLSLFLFFLVPISCLTACLLTDGYF
jgi:hypothetical protein